MGDYIPDPIERMDMRIDDLAHEQFAGVPDDSIRCYGCKEIVPVDSVEAISGNPDAPAYCPACADGIYTAMAANERQ